MRRFILLTALLASLAGGADARAQHAPGPEPHVPAKPAEARDRLEQAVRAMLNRPDVRFDAIHIVERTGGVFDVAVEGFGLASSGRSRLASKPLKAQASRAGDDAWRFDYAAAAEFVGVDEEGQPLRFRVHDARTVFVWSETLQSITNMNVDWREISIESGPNPPMRLDRIAVRSDLAREPSGGWSWPGELRIEKLAIEDPGGASVEIGSVAISISAAGRNAEGLAAMVRMQQQESSLEALTNLRGLLSSFNVGAVVEGLRVQGPDGPVHLGEVGVQIALTKLDEPASDLQVGYRHAGLSARATPEFEAFAPVEAQLKLTLARAPMEALLQAGLAGGLEYMLTGQVDSAPAIIDSLRKALPEAGTELRVDDGLFRTARSRITAAGAFFADAAAPLGVTGALGVTISGMDALLANATGPDGGAVAKSLAALQRIADRTADSRALLYRFELSRDGRALVNGRPLAELLAE
jgi:hypothetical protein